VVKAFNTIFYKTPAEDPRAAGGNRVFFVSDNDSAAKAQVSQLIEPIGFSPVDLGDLATGSKLLLAKGPLATLNLIKL
jgi:predicted dinucleotide-binding enzyme